MSYDYEDPPDRPKSPAVQAALQRGQGGGQRRTKSEGPGDDYVEVKERIQWFYATYPEGALVTSKLQMLVIGGADYVVVQAEAFRNAGDPHPGTGSSWMAVPGTTPYTRGSELENTETSAWGRAIASLGGLVDRSVASAQEIRSKGGDEIEPPSRPGNAETLRAAAATAAAEVPAVEVVPDPEPEPEPEKPKAKKEKPPKAEEPPPSPPEPVDAPEPVSAAPVAGEATPEPPGEPEQAPATAGMAVTRGEDGKAGLDYDEFMRLAREKFIPTGHIGATARNLVEKGVIRPTDSVKKMDDEERLSLLLAAMATFDEPPPAT